MLILISLFLSIVPSRKTEILDFAEKFFSAGCYEEAITEYKRFIFFHPKDEEVSYVYSRIARIHRLCSEWDEAVDAHERAIITAADDSVKQMRKLELAVTYIAAGNYSMAEVLLLKIEVAAVNLEIKKRCALLRAVAEIHSYKWDYARDAFSTYFLYSPDTVLQQRINEVLAEREKFFYRSPSSARQLSTFIPGLGQLYAGDAANALNAFLLNGGLITWMVYKAVHGYWSDAWVIYYFLFRRYYFGNKYNAKRIAGEKNRSFNQSQIQKIMELLVSE